MDNRKEFDRAKIEEAFRIMGRYLLERGTLGEITIYRGSAILFQFDWRRTSVDVDARIISDGHHGIVTQAAQQAAKQLDLPQSWLNESVAMYARRQEQDSDRTFVGSIHRPSVSGCAWWQPNQAIFWQ
jgi:hypothetical protein